jgi:hypothetical protein
MTSEHFVGRKQNVAQLKELIRSNGTPFPQNPDDDTLRILSIWGKAGVGKTSLIEHVFKNEPALLKNQLILRSGKAKTPQSIATVVTNDFIRDLLDIPEETFAATLNCRKIIQSLDVLAIDRAVKKVKDKSQRDKVRNTLIKELGLLGVRYLNKRVESVLRESPDFDQYADQLIDSFQDRTPTRLATFTAGIGLPNRSFRLQVDIDKELADSLLADIRQIVLTEKLKKRSLIVVIDDYEALEPLMERFLLQFFLRSLEKETFRTLVIVIGRDELPWSTDWDKYNHHKSDSIGLDVLEESEARSLLQKMGIYDEKVQNEILEKSHSLPLLLEVLGQAYSSGRQAEWVEDYFQRVTYQMTDKQKEWVQALCFLDVRIDKETIEMMLPNAKVEDVMTWFKGEASARSSSKDGWQMDPIVKAMIQARVEQESLRTTKEFREKAEQARKTYVQLMDSLPKK